jgi:hypothetical protein
MAEVVNMVSWEAYEHAHSEKKADWFWVLGMITLAVTVAAVILGNTLFGIVVLVAGFVMSLTAIRPARIIPYEISTRSIRIDDLNYPYSTLRSFYIDEENPTGPQLLVQSNKMFMPLLILPLPEEYVDDVEELIAARLPEEFLEEPLIHKLLEMVGF